jgi:hypothetical protein
MALPLCHLFIGNQFTQYGGSAAAFGAMSEAVMDELYEIYSAHPERFTERGVVPSRELFQEKYVYELRDFNSSGVVAAHEGRMLSDLRETSYRIHNTTVRLDRGRIKLCSESVDAIVADL